MREGEEGTVIEVTGIRGFNRHFPCNPREGC